MTNKTSRKTKKTVSTKSLKAISKTSTKISKNKTGKQKSKVFMFLIVGSLFNIYTHTLIQLFLYRRTFQKFYQLLMALMKMKSNYLKMI